MQGNITGFMYNPINKKTILQLELSGNQLAYLERYKDKELTVELKNYRKKRSLNANSYAWLLINKIAEATGLPDVEVYRNYIKNMGVYQDIEINEKAENTLKIGWSANGLGWFAERVDYSNIEGFVVLRLFYGSSRYNSKQMSRLISEIVQDCTALGIPTMTPTEIANLVSLWDSEREAANGKVSS